MFSHCTIRAAKPCCQRNGEYPGILWVYSTDSSYINMVLAVGNNKKAQKDTIYSRPALS